MGTSISAQCLNYFQITYVFFQKKAQSSSRKQCEKLIVRPWVVYRNHISALGHILLCRMVDTSWAQLTILKLWNSPIDRTAFEKSIREGLDKGVDSSEIEQLAKGLFLAGTSTSKPYKVFLYYFSLLPYSGNLKWSSYLLTMTQFDRWEESDCVGYLCQMLVECASSVQCTYSIESECNALSDSMVSTFQWILKGLAECDNIEDDEKREASSSHLLTAVLHLAADKFFLSLMRTRTDISSSILPLMSNITTRHPISPQFSELKKAIESFTVSPHFKGTDYLVNNMQKSFAAIRTACAVFANFRVLATVEEVAETFVMTGTTMGMSNEQVLRDVIMSSLFMLMEKAEMNKIEMFVFLRLPRILAALLKRGFLVEEVENALRFTARRGKEVLDVLDARYGENEGGKDTWEQIVEKLHKEKLVGGQCLQDAVQIRKENNHKGKTHPFLDVKHDKLRNAVEKSYKDPAVLMKILMTSIGSDGRTFDCLCATYCGDERLPELSCRLATLNRQSESPSGDASRLASFDLTFILLSRILDGFSELSLREAVNGNGGSGRLDNTRGIFFLWSAKYVRADVFPIEEIVDQHEKDEFRSTVRQLSDGQQFNYNGDLASLIWKVPLLGEILLDEFRDAKKHPEYDISNVMWSFRAHQCVVLCLVQWLEGRSYSEGRLLLARKIRSTLDEFPLRHEHDSPDDVLKWKFLRIVCERSLCEMAEGKRVTDCVTLRALSIVNRPLPVLLRHEIPDKEMLKKALIYASRQCWATANVLSILDKCNQVGQHNSWLESWVHNLTKQTTNEDMIGEMELVLCGCLLDPLPSFRAACQVLGDFVWKHTSELYPPFFVFCGRFIAYVLIMSVWAIEEAEKKLGGRRESEENEEGADDGKKLVLAQILELRETIVVFFNRMHKNALQGTLRNVVAFICITVHELANAPRTPAWKKLTEMVPHELLFILGRIDSYSITSELFACFCDENSKEHLKEKIRFVCMERKLGSI